MKYSNMAFPCTLVVLSVVFISIIEPTLTNPTTTVTQGELVGTWMTSRNGRTFAAFKGIPYAAPPTGDLRFKSPVPAKPWVGVRNASRDAEACVQPHPYYVITGHEDCLYLNVYTPNVTDEAKLPVLFLIHGGIFRMKGGHSFFYNPQYLLDEDVVVVTINYRLGVFGFLSFGDKELPGNFGLKDQRLALRWVKDNIAKFGGDPKKVTLFGENAGAASVHYHLLFNTDEGLFRAGILHSGSALTAGSFQRPEEQKPVIKHILNQTNCVFENSPEVVDCLRKVFSLNLSLIFEQFNPPHNHPVRKCAPVIEPACAEDAFVTDDPWKRTSSLPMIIGTNQHEGLVSVRGLLKDETDEKFNQINSDYKISIPYNLLFNSSAEDPEGVAQQIKEYYLKDEKIDRKNALSLINLMSDGMFNYGVTKAVKNNVNKSYLYSLNYLVSSSIVDFKKFKNTYGPTNSDDLPLFFPVTKHPNFSEADLKVSQQLIKMWISFVSNLDPTPEGTSILWKPAGADLEFLNINGPENFTMESHFYKDRMDFWDNLPFRNKPLPLLDPAHC